ncbi:zinc ABC transporter substrate-binding protein [Actinosynnema pretiosum subsp. pretiosum]|uniref:Zinc ABC transporter substrate-binding protein n=1 Tax=Actinosynnema pretiosum subsp. pretiosum TaxID=103721 RepID=A0AA45R3T8_9PSEU|nr:periplasmic solute binding protein [Actinosynnema pretiosum subsp. pretiosum]QUF04202.1 zinc ABC transporter substrate-binding protein [Actinosynnema pretiosum subsp. pretiosum]
MPQLPRVVGAITSIALLTAACGAAGGATSDGRPVVLTTFTVLADIAANVAGGRLRVESITRPGVEVHGYEPTPADVKKAARADLVVDNGLGLEAWAAKYTEDAGAPRVVASAGVTPIPISEDARAGEPNPHAWMSPLTTRAYVDNLVAAFSDLAPEHAGHFRANGERYRAELLRAHEDLVSALRAVPEDRRSLVTCEGAFPYLARDAGLTDHYLWAVNAERQATPRQVARVVDHVRAAGVPAVFCESTVSDAPMRQVAAATGAAFGGVLHVDSLSEPDGPVPTYLDLIRHDARTIAAALTGGAR